MDLPFIDILVIVAYVVGTVLFGSWFVRRSRTTDGFTKANGRIPMVVVGLSIFGTFVSSISFLALPGKAYMSNWNSYVLSFTLPIATFFAAKWFVPFYRNNGIVSTYQHLEARFGVWARIYATLCYMITQIARIGAVAFLMALPLNCLLGWNITVIIVATGILTIIYSMLGGIEGIVWTDALQSLILVLGAGLCVVLLLLGMPEGPSQLFKIAVENNKFSLGSFAPNLTESTFWVVFIYGMAINLQNFGADQNFVQRYLTAKSEADAKRSIWLNAWLYLFVSAGFFFIGTALFAYYEAQPDKMAEMAASVGQMLIANGTPPDQVAAKIGDSVFPYFIIRQLPAGATGLLIAAIFSAAMSTISTSLNGCATLTLTDFYKRFFRKNPTPKEEMSVLYLSTVAWGGLGIGAAILFIHAKQMLDAWWILQGILGGGILGLFLLGFVSKRAKNVPAAIAVVLGLCLIIWMSLTPLKAFDFLPEVFRSCFCPLLIPVFGTITIFLAGFLLTVLFFPKKNVSQGE